MHLRKVQIANKLHLLGLGGSVPSFCEGKQHWEGFPYTTDKEFGVELAELLDPVIQDESTPLEESYIIMTHDGPNCSSEY